MRANRILLTGATGFVGSAVYPSLMKEREVVRCGTRHPDEARKKEPARTFVRFDTSDSTSMEQALDGCDAALYLIHSMADGRGDYEATEAKAAERFLRAAEKVGVKRIVYLGGIEPSGEPSKHLRSRLKTGEILRGGSISTIELRASMIVGEGSESWRIVRDLSSRLPFMLLPRWLKNRSQPVWVGDVTTALVAAVDDDATDSQVFAIPGADTLSGREMLAKTSGAKGMEPVMVSVPFLSPQLSTHWISLVTRANRRVAAELVQGLTSDIVSRPEQSYWRRIDHRPLGFDEAVKRTIGSEAGSLPLGVRTMERLIQRFSPHKS